MKQETIKEAMNYITAFLLFLIGCTSLAYNAAGAEPIKTDTKIKLVVIDPGHGGKDPGAVFGGVREKDLVLDIALKLGSYITAEFPDTKVMYTRSKDVFVPLHQRASFANRLDADLFISIHVNYASARSVQGTETFVLGQHRSQDNLEVAKKENAVILLEDDYTTTYEGFDPNSPESYIMFELVQDEYLEQSVMLASAIQHQFRDRAKRVDRSVKQAGFLVLRQTTMPSVLVEAGFLSHSAEREYMASDMGKTHLASAIFRAFKDYKKKIEAKSSFNLVINPSEPEPVAEKVRELAPEIFTENQMETINDIYFSVQIAALKAVIDTKPENFHGEKQVFKMNSGNIYRYYAGKFNSYEQAAKEKARLESTFGGAFVVAFENDELISVKKALRKM